MKALLLILSALLFSCMAPSETDDTGKVSSMTRKGGYGDGLEMGNGVPAEAVHGWSRVGELVSGNTDKSVSVQQDFDEAGPYTCNFSLVPVDDISAADVATLSAEAIIEWGVGGNTITRRISVTNGASISGNAKAVRVVIVDTSEAEGGATVLGKTYQVSVSIARGTRPSTDQPPILQEQNIVFVVAGGTNQDVAIPQGAGVKSVWVAVAGLAGAAIADQGARVTQTTAANTAISMYDPRAITWAPLAPGATKINLANLTLVNQVYAVYWGIDG